MHPTEYANLAAHENTHWWFVGKRRLIAQMLRRYRLPDLETGTILDIGCGTGATLAALSSVSPHVLGLDYAADALKWAKQRHPGRLGRASVLQIPLASNSIDLVTILDVLYHQWVSNDAQALAELYRILKPNGLLIITDSAFSFLSGPHDEINLAARRYTLPPLRDTLSQLGFRILKQSYAYAFLLPIAFLRRWWQRTFASQHTPQSDVEAVPAWLNSLLLLLFSTELNWLRFGRLPWGTSILFVVRK
jgi:ubiquinone/menaquinone biosynthesis C-methylase UbiE